MPSAKGYWYYLDNLLTDDQPLDRVTRARVEVVFASLDHEPEKLAQGAAKALAAISGCTAAVSTPCAEDLCIAHYEVVQVGRSAAAVLAVTTAGYVRTRVAGGADHGFGGGAARGPPSCGGVSKQACGIEGGRRDEAREGGIVVGNSTPSVAFSRPRTKRKARSARAAWWRGRERFRGRAS